MKKMTATDARKLTAYILTVHGYRNSPIEDIHASGRISQEEMKHLNKTILDQIYTLLYLFEKDLLFNNHFLTDRASWSGGDQPKLLKRWVKTCKQKDYG
jgi:hypothetical protein